MFLLAPVARPPIRYAPTTDGRHSLAYFVHTTASSSVPDSPPPVSEIEGGRGRYVYESSARPLILIQGWAGVSSDWGALPNLFAAKGRPVVTFDARGLGQSKKHQLSEPDASNDGRRQRSPSPGAAVRQSREDKSKDEKNATKTDKMSLTW